MPKPKLPPKKFKWTPKLAYAVGLLVTDGNLSGDGRHITMRSVDVDLLKTFRSCIDLEGNKIATTHNDRNKERPCYRLQFSKIQLYNWLVGIGVTPAKTFTINSIKIPDKFFRDFLRGHLDGDGSIYTYLDKQKIKGHIYKNQRVYTKFMSASKNHAIWLYNKIQKLSGIRCAFSNRTYKKSNRMPIWEIKFAKKASPELWRWIYYKKDLPCLERKRILSERFSEAIKKEKRKQYTRIN